MEKSILLKDEVPCCFILKLANYVFFGIKHFLIPFIFIVSTITFLQAQSVITDKLDYNPAEIANITAKGYHIGETVQFLILHTDGTPNTGGGHLPWTVVDGGVNDIDGLANGIIETSWYVNPDDSFNSVFELTAQGLTSNIFSKHVFIDDTPIPTNIVTNYNNGTLTLNVDWSWVELNGAEKVLGVAVFADTDGDGDLPGLESSYPGGFLPEEFLGQTVEGSVEGCTNGDCTTGGIGAGNVGDNVPHTLFPNGLTPPEVGVTSGSFIITFTGLSNAPKSICVITYDIHVTSKDNPPGVYTIKGNNHSPITSGDDRNKDNSVEEGHSDITVSCDDLCNPDDVTCKIQDISTNCSVPNPLIDPAEVFDNSILCSGSMISIDSKVITNICVNDSFTRTYTLFFDDDGNGILDSGEEIIKECPQLITITPAVISCSVQGVNPSCNGNQNGYLTASASGGCGDLDYSLDGVTYQEDGVFSGLSSGVYIVTVKDENDCTSTCEVTISNPAALSCSIEGTDPSCGGSDGSLIATGVGGTGDLDYSLDGVTYQEDGVFSGLLSGVYAVTVKDENDCTSICEVTLSNPATLSCNIVQDSAVSTNGGSDGEATVTPVGGTPPYTYLWDNGETTVQATGLNAGLHSVTVTDSQNCETSCEIIIEEPDDLNCSTSEDSPVICNGESNGMATVTPVGGTSPYSYLWDNGETTVQATGLNAGTHSVIVTDASQGETICEVVIDEPDALEASAEGATISCSCYGSSDGSIDLTVIGGTQDYTYLWSPGGETTEDLSGLSAGTYSVLVTDANGCTTTEEVVIGEPGMLSCNVIQDSPASSHDTADGVATVIPDGGTPPYAYLWDNGETTEQATSLNTGEHSVTVTDSQNCETTCDIIIECLPDELNCSVVEDSPVICNGESNGVATVSPDGGVPPYSYLWDNGETTAQATGLNAGMHSVTVTDAYQTESTCEVMIEEPDTLEASVEGAITNCSCYGSTDGEINLTVSGGTPPYMYLWSNGATSEDLSDLSAGTYSVIVTDTNGCITDEEVTIGEPGALICNIIQDSPVSTYGGDDGEATVSPDGGVPPYTYLWDNGETTAQATNLTAGAHSIIVTDALYCETTCGITIEESGSSVCNIYPVPFVDTVNIEYLLGNLSEALIEVYDMKGRLIKTKSDKNIYFRKVTKFNLGHKVFSNQVYFVKVTSGGKSTMKRVVSKR